MYKELSDSEPENVDLLFRYAASLRKAGKSGDALKAYERVEKLEGLSDTLANSRIAVYREIGDAAGEEATLMALLKAFPGETKNYTRLGEFYATHSQPEKAAQVYQQMAEKFPYLVTPHLELAKHYKALGQTDKAFASAVRGFSSRENLEEKMALLYEWYPAAETAPALSPAARKEADSLSRILRRVHPDKAEPYIASGDYFYKEGRIKEARDQYHLATAIAQEQYAPWKRLLEINDKLKDNATQEKDCKAAMELFPTQPEAYYYLGMIQLAKKDYRNAINNLESARDYMYDAPKELQVKAALVDAYRKTDDNLKADQYAEDVIEKDSSNLKLIADYCASLSERRIKLYNAEQMMLSVVAKEPGNASYLEILGWIEYRMNDYKAAKPYMEQALAKDPGNARMNERMGDIYFRLGQTEEALAHWKKAKEKGGTNPALERKISSKSMQDNE
jgi:tetratricopeptide (TPR) repeat protein